MTSMKETMFKTTPRNIRTPCSKYFPLSFRKKPVSISDKMTIWKPRLIGPSANFIPDFSGLLNV